MAKKLTIEYVRAQVGLISDSELLSDAYVNNTTPLMFRCSCGETFERPWMRFREGHTKCFSCGTREQYDRKRLGLQVVTDRLSDFGISYVSGDYKNQKSILRVVYRCGHEGDLLVNNIYNKSFTGDCQSCRRSQKTRLDVFTVALTADLAYGVELVSDEYVDAHSPLQFRCSCGEIFVTSWNNFLSGKRRCDHCGKRVSRGELAVAHWLEKNGIAFETQRRFPDCADKRSLPFDFYLPGKNLCIEFDGRQHFEPVAAWEGSDRLAYIRAHDAVKDAYCKSCGIDLLRIPYTDLDKIDDILNSKLIPRKADS